jgi:Tfp pilus assembly protein PilV
MVEVLVAVLVLVIGLLGVFGTFSSSARSTAAAETAAAMAQAGQQQLQAVSALPYAAVADKAAPTKTTTTDTTNPTYYLSTCGGNTCFQWDTTNTADVGTLAVDATNGQISAGPVSVLVPAPNSTTCAGASPTNCKISLSVYTFVTLVTDPVCSQSGVSCTGSSYERVTVAVKSNGTNGPLHPVYLSTFVANNVGGGANPLTLSTTTCTDGSTSGLSCLH